jgi:CubicO group peptidase (beta-lactamase class C family)
VSDDSDVRPFFFNSFILGKDPDGLLLPFKRSRDAMTDFHYISPNSHVLSAVLRGVYKKPIADIMTEKIWQPLGMEADATWLQHRDDAKGLALGYCCLNARLRDYARFGEFYLKASNGQGLGESTLPDGWVERLPKPATPSHQPGGEQYSGRGYSYHFWLPEQEGPYFAAGVYGQFIWIDPARNLVIVKTSADNDFLTRHQETAVVFEAISEAYD